MVNSDKSIESSDTLSGAKGLLSTDKSNESSSISVGNKSLDATDKSIESSQTQAGDKDPSETDTSAKSNKSSSSQEGNTSTIAQAIDAFLHNKATEATEAWLAGITIFDERKTGSPKWGDLPEDDDEGNQSSKVIVDGQVEGNINEKGDNVPTSIDFNPNDPRLYNQVPMTREYSGIAPSDAVHLPKSPFADVRAHTYVNENGKQQSPSKTQVQE